jgi:alkylation response protein AidB-like acyl-CoA dehydrogenase
MEMTFSFDELEIQKSVRRFVRSDLLPIRKALEQSGEMPNPVKEKFLSMGLLRSVFPEPYGGVNGSFTGFVMALKELSYGSLVPSWLLFENFLLGYAILRYGSEDLKNEILPGLISLETIGGLAFTETETGSDPTQIRTVARKTEGGWILNGSKRFITHSEIGDHLILFARTGDAVTAFLVETRNKGYRAGKRESFIHATAFDNGDIYLEDYFARDSRVIGNAGQGFQILLESEAIGKVAFSALFAGLAERALDLALKYATTRAHRGTPIGEKFQLTQLKLAEMKTKVEAMKAYLFQVCAKVDRGEEILMEAAVLKILTAGFVKEITAEAMEVHGAYGLSQEYEIGELYKTAISAQVVMGSLDIQRVIIAKSLLARARTGP